METKDFPLTKKEYLWLLERRVNRKYRKNWIIFFLLFLFLFFFVVAMVPAGPRTFFIGLLLGIFLSVCLIFLIHIDRMVKKFGRNWDIKYEIKD